MGLSCHVCVLLILLSATPLTFAHTHQHGVDLGAEYSFKSVLHNKTGSMGRDIYTLHWRFDLENRTIYFAVNVSTNGWVGFGLSPNGGMIKSDVVIGWVSGNTTYFHVSS